MTKNRATALVALASLILASLPARATEKYDTARVVTIGGAATEIVYALGLSDKVVAVDTSSTFPPAALATHPNVGYIRALSPEGVLSVGPTLIIAMDGAGPPDAVNVLKSASIPFVTIPEARDGAQVVANIRRVAEIMGVPDGGASVADAVAADFTALAAMRAKITTPRTATFVLSTSGAAPIVGGTDTSADAIFRLAGIGNAMTAIKGYKPAVDEAMLAAEPYAVILMQDRGHGVTNEMVMQMPAFASTQAAQAKRFFRVDGAYTLSFGPRTPQAAHDLAVAVYPELNLPALPQHAWNQ